MNRFVQLHKKKSNQSESNWVLFNPRSKDTEMAQVCELQQWGRQGPIYSA